MPHLKYSKDIQRNMKYSKDIQRNMKYSKDIQRRNSKDIQMNKVHIGEKKITSPSPH